MTLLGWSWGKTWRTSCNWPWRLPRSVSRVGELLPASLCLPLCNPPEDSSPSLQRRTGKEGSGTVLEARRVGAERHGPPGKAQKWLEAQSLGNRIFRTGRGHPEAAARETPSFCSWDAKVSKAKRPAQGCNLTTLGERGEGPRSSGGQLCLLCHPPSFLLCLSPSLSPPKWSGGQGGNKEEVRKEGPASSPSHCCKSKPSVTTLSGRVLPDPGGGDQVEAG